MRLRRIDPIEGEDKATEWGFPRKILTSDRLGHWFLFRWGVVWLEEVGLSNAWPVHLAVDPSYRKRGWPFLKAFKELQEVHARDLSNGEPGILYVLEGSKEIEPYLERLGFKRQPGLGIWYVEF